MAGMRAVTRALVRAGAGLVVVLAATLAAAPAAASYAHPQLLVETGELARLLGAAGIRIVDLRGDPVRGEAAYRAGHVPGAVYLDARRLDDARANSRGFPIWPESAARLFGGLGIDEDTTVVAYDDAGGVLAARLFFVLEYYGHPRIRLLNGGLAKWRADGRPLVPDSAPVASRRFVPRARRELLATAEEVRAGLGKAEVSLIDARSPGEFAGREVRARRAGRIPGARNVEWATTLNPDQTFKSAEALRALFEAAGIRPDRQVVVYCQTGTRSAHDYFALRLLGYARIRNYDGSWDEWGNDPAAPIE
jgi:thiosulfate/3-mercaptopyruvate sulfurtransferase